MQDIYIIGGSNSLLAGGWASNLRATRSDRFRITNLSIGAATTLIGIYRILCDEVPDGATVVWEYALNESNHRNAGQSLQSLMRHFGWFMELAHHRKLHVLPVVIWTRPEHVKLTRNDYRAAVMEKIDSLGLNCIDAWNPMIAFAKDRQVPVPDLYLDDMHYAPQGGFPAILAELIADAISSAKIPNAQPEFSGKSLRLCAPAGPVSETFKNSLFSAEVHHLTAPLHVEGRGHLLASYVIAANDAGALTVSIGDKIHGAYSLQGAPGYKDPGRLLKHLVHWQTFDDIGFVDGNLMLTGAEPEGRPKVQNMFSWRGPLKDGLRQDGYICSLLEEQG